jgi:PAS domain-containing protein
MEAGQRPLELILARNLLASLSTPAFLIDGRGEIAFYNDAAGALLGRHYEDTGPMPAQEWTRTFGPFDGEGNPIPFDRLGLTTALRENRAAHDRLCVKPLNGEQRPVEASALPIVGVGGYRGAIVVFWPADEGEGSGG